VAGLEILFDSHDHAVFINIYRLENGDFPTYPDLKSYDSRKNGFDFLLTLKNTHSDKMFSPFIDNSCNSVEQVLSNYAKCISIYSADVLKGNFEDFGDFAQKHVK